ncbi:hypothetical protein [Pedobacter psychrodurus]|nr:hypothetical protein [Pedobacter psychrodurus]
MTNEQKIAKYSEKASKKVTAEGRQLLSEAMKEGVKVPKKG